MCVDYQHKVTHDKAKAIRLVKLRFSRMILYFGGVIAVAETWNMPAHDKRKRLAELLSFPTTGRIKSVIGNEANEAINAYATFLEALNDQATRDKLEDADLNLATSKEFQKLRCLAQNFRAELRRLLEDRYPENHPIHMSLIF